MSKSTPINQLPKSMPSQDPNDDDDIAIQEVLAEINAQERSQRQGLSQVQSHPSAQYQSSMPPPPPPVYEPPQAPPRTTTQPDPLYYQPMPQHQQLQLPPEFLKWQEAQNAPSWTETATMFVKSEGLLFLIVVIVSVFLQLPLVQNWLIDNLHFVNIPHIEIITIAVVSGILTVVGKALTTAYLA